MDSEREQRIRELAYTLWEQAGGPPGGADEYWYEAERQLRGDADQGLREEPGRFEDEAGSAAADLEPVESDSVDPVPTRSEPIESTPTRSAKGGRRAAMR